MLAIWTCPPPPWGLLVDGSESRLPELWWSVGFPGVVVDYHHDLSFSPNRFQGKEKDVIILQKKSPDSPFHR